MAPIVPGSPARPRLPVPEFLVVLAMMVGGLVLALLVLHGFGGAK